MISSTEEPTDDIATRSLEKKDSPQVSVRQIAKEIVSVEEDVPKENATGDPYHNVYTALIQTHLPKLDNVDAIEYDPDRKDITPDENLIAFAMAAALTSSVAQLLFHDAVGKGYDDDISDLD